jgi:hypothetical protein
MKRIIMAALGVLLVSVMGCQKGTANIVLNEIMGYTWNTPIEEIQKDFNEKQYTEIEVESDYISAKGDYYGLTSDIYFVFFNGKMYAGGISYLGFPDEEDVSDDGYTMDDINNIQKSILELLCEKYGNPQEVEENKEEFEGEIRYYKWNFKNNCQLELRLKIQHFILTSCEIDVRFTNNAVYEKKKLADESKKADIEPEQAEEHFDENELQKIAASGQRITMTALESDSMKFSMGGKGILIIDWGDWAREISRFSEKYSIQDYGHDYSGKSTYVITIYAEYITNLNCSGNSFHQKISALDVGKCTTLEYLDCGFGQLTSLDLSNNTALRTFDCFSNQLTALDISKNVDLYHLDCGGNKITSLDVSRNEKLIGLYCYSGQLTNLNVNNASLQELRCQDNQLTNLDLSGATALSRLDCDRNRLTSLDLSNNKMLGYLQCYNNQIKSLDIRNNTALWELKCSDNLLTNIDIGRNQKLKKIDCGTNNLTGLDVSGCRNLEWLDLRINQFTSLDVKANTNLENLVCSDNLFSANTLNDLFRTLHGNKEKGELGKAVIIGNNPGTKGCDTKIAKNKGWTIYTHGFAN